MNRETTTVTRGRATGRAATAPTRTLYEGPTKGRVDEILSYYPSDSAGTKASLRRLFEQGRLAGTGRLVILPVDQGFEHGPHRSFAANPPAYDPEYHPRFALAAGMSGYAAPLGFIEAVAGNYAGDLPLILKLNNHDLLWSDDDPIPAVTGSVEAAVRLGCVAIGYTIYPGSAHRQEMYENLQFLAESAKAAGLAVVVWSYPRGSGVSAEGETALDVVAYGAHLACQMGAHVVKVKLPSDHLEQKKAKEVYEELEIPRESVADRVRNVVQAAFDGKRIIIFSGGSKRGDEPFFEDIRGIRDGGGYGSIIGRNTFQRPWDDSLRFIGTVIDIYRGEA
ncbi:MAG TPA: class I fructose-bisphosphate aldolase [Gemmatimonadota bacterium]|nr:class I fructose-bisphosphate aldolase [Gemmatimonadota bacterium]